MTIRRLDPANSPITYVRVAEANGIAYFTDHVARHEYHTAEEQTRGILARYEELFQQFGYEKRNVVYGVHYIDEACDTAPCDAVWRAWLGDVDAKAMWVKSKLSREHRVALTLFVATNAEAAAKARADAGWTDTLEDVHRMEDKPIRTTVHNEVAYLVGGACRDGSPIDQQTRSILRDMEAEMARLGLRKENLIFQFSYVSDRADVDLDGYEQVWQNWVGKGTQNPPSGVRVQLRLPEDHDVEISMMIAM